MRHAVLQLAGAFFVVAGALLAACGSSDDASTQVAAAGSGGSAGSDAGAKGGSGGSGTGGQPGAGGQAGTGGTGGGDAGSAGAAGGAAGAGGGSAKTPVVLASKVDRPCAVAVDDSTVYWANYLGSINKVDKNGGTPAELVANASSSTLLLDAGNIYYCNSGDIYKVPTGGGTPVVVADLDKGGFCDSIARDATHLYWVYYSYQGTASSGAVMRVPVEGGAPEIVEAVADSLYAVAVDDANVYWTQPGGLRSKAKAGGTVNSLASGTGFINAPITRNATDLFFRGSANALYRLPKAGGAPTKLAANVGLVMTLAVDSDHLYSTNNDPGGAVARVPLSGGTQETIATDPEGVRGLALDATHVYWTVMGPFNEPLGSILKVEK